MNKTQELALTTIEKNNWFHVMLFFYPEPFRKKFGEEMLLFLSDVYQEELAKNGKVGISFWMTQGLDISKNIIEEHLNYLGKFGFKKYMKNVLHFNKYNALGIFFLLPFVSMFAIDLVTRLITGNLLRPNVQLLNGIYNSPLYWGPILFMWVILFPLLAVAINVIPLIKNTVKSKNGIWNSTFLKVNLVTLAIILLGLSWVLFLKVHDSVPCFINHIINQGFTDFGHTIKVCKKA